MHTVFIVSYFLIVWTRIHYGFALETSSQGYQEDEIIRTLPSLDPLSTKQELGEPKEESVEATVRSFLPIKGKFFNYYKIHILDVSLTTVSYIYNIKINIELIIVFETKVVSSRGSLSQGRNFLSSRTLGLISLRFHLTHSFVYIIAFALVHKRPTYSHFYVVVLSLNISSASVTSKCIIKKKKKCHHLG